MIRSSVICFFVILISVVWITAPSSATMTSNSYSISASVFSGGGGRMDSPGYSLVGTIGQSSPLGVAADQDFELRSGFWESASRLAMRNLGLTPAIYLLLLGE